MLLLHIIFCFTQLSSFYLSAVTVVALKVWGPWATFQPCTVGEKERALALRQAPQLEATTLSWGAEHAIDKAILHLAFCGGFSFTQVQQQAGRQVKDKYIVPLNIRWQRTALKSWVPQHSQNIQKFVPQDLACLVKKYVPPGGYANTCPCFSLRVLYYKNILGCV